ncbi:GDSL-type esterase/lipase family protein [Cohnella caldifontis]|uniref:GDSL-type esterase/lipase family protein n=1 Tax=Cohnella caldifontis TaxID=3027471 RepID=UPI0023ECF916|nr:GDSL-type esterase/lipase family protein [Cohnella sp. YIM B05605]
MRPTSWLWRGLGAVTLVCLIVLLAGFGLALKDHWAPSAGMAIPEASKPPAAAAGSLASKPELKITALGDSLTVGTGDETGNGYVKTAAADLSKAMGKPVRVINNLAIGGLRADQLLEHLDDKGYVDAIVQADIVMLTIGANDLFEFATDGGSLAQGSEISPEQLDSRLPVAEKRLSDVLAALRMLNGAARIVYVGLYNPFYDVESLRIPASDTIQKWNAYAHGFAAADGNATVVPTFDLFESDIGSYLSSDHFHPNEAGYARIAARIVQALQ